MESRRNSSGTSSQDSIRCSSVIKSKIYWADWEKHQKISHEEFYLCQCSTKFPVEQKTMNKNVWHTLESYLCMQGSLVIHWFRFWEKVVLHQKGQCTRNLGQSRRRCWWNSPKADVRCSVLRLHCPEVSSKSKGHGKLTIHFAATNQLSLYGAVAEMCEEYESLHDRSGRPDMVMGQSIVLSAIKTEVSLDFDDPTNQDLLLQQYGERIKKLSQQDKLSKFWMDAGFFVVEIGQYFMTKDTGDLTQFHAVTTCCFRLLSAEIFPGGSAQIAFQLGNMTPEMRQLVGPWELVGPARISSKRRFPSANSSSLCVCAFNASATASSSHPREHAVMQCRRDPTLPKSPGDAHSLPSGGVPTLRWTLRLSLFESFLQTRTGFRLFLPERLQCISEPRDLRLRGPPSMKTAVGVAPASKRLIDCASALGHCTEGGRRPRMIWVRPAATSICVHPRRTMRQQNTANKKLRPACNMLMKFVIEPFSAWRDPPNVNENSPSNVVDLAAAAEVWKRVSQRRVETSLQHVSWLASSQTSRFALELVEQVRHQIPSPHKCADCKMFELIAWSSLQPVLTCVWVQLQEKVVSGWGGRWQLPSPTRRYTQNWTRVGSYGQLLAW